MAPSPAAGRGGNNAGLADPLLPGGGEGGSAKDKYWVPAEEEEETCHGEEDGRPPPPPLYRMFKVSGVLLHPYRLLTLIRLIAVVLFLIWRMKHRDSDAMWLWWISVAGDFWFGVTWLLNQASKLNPIKRVPDLSLLRQSFDDLPTAGEGGGSLLPGLDVFINTVDPVDEPMLYPSCPSSPPTTPPSGTPPTSPTTARRWSTTRGCSRRRGSPRCGSHSAGSTTSSRGHR